MQVMPILDAHTDVSPNYQKILVHLGLRGKELTCCRGATKDLKLDGVSSMNSNLDRVL